MIVIVRTIFHKHDTMPYLKNLFLIFGIFGLAACSSGTGEEKPTAYAQKKTQLDSLKKEQTALNDKIASLEQEVLALRPDSLIKRIAVHAGQPKQGTFKHYITIQGKIENKNSVMINPKMAGRVSKIYVKEGQKVRAGQALARVDASVMYEQLQELKTALKLADTLYKKQKKLHEQNVGTEVDYLNAKNNKEGLERQLQSLQTQINQSAITSTISGVVDEVFVKTGESTAPGAPAFRVVNHQDVVVSVPVPDRYLGDLVVGKSVEVFFPDVEDTVQGKIAFISASIDPINRTFEIEVDIPKSQKSENVRANMLAVVKINDKTYQNALYVDKNIIQQDEQGDKVFVVVEKDGMKRALAKSVELGTDYGGEVLVKKGLDAEDQLVTQGYQDLVDGDPLKIMQK